MPLILDGKAMAALHMEAVRSEVAALLAAGARPPGLAVVLVGDDPASHVYVGSKGRQTVAAGMRSFEHRLPADAPEAALLALVDALNDDGMWTASSCSCRCPATSTRAPCWSGSAPPRTWTASTR